VAVLGGEIGGETVEAPTRVRALHRRVPTWPATAARAALGTLLVVGALVGAGLRWWLISHVRINSDQAIVGLQARGILHGHFVAFYAGQHYGGVEPYLVAALFAVFGQGPTVLVTEVTLVALAGSVVVWRIGRRVFPEAAALTAAVAAWIWPWATLANSTRQYGFHQVGVLLGLLVLLFALRVAQEGRPGPGQLVDWAFLGLFGGLAWWSTPETVYFALPALLIVLTGLWGRWSVSLLPRAGLLLAGFCLGALPWIVVSFRTHFATLHAVAAPVPHNSYGKRLGTFFTHVLPVLFGVQVPTTGSWEGPTGVAVVAWVLALALVVGAMVVVAVRVPLARGLVLFCALFPFLYAVSPTTWFWEDARYGVFLAPVLALVVCGGLWTVLRRVGAEVAGAALLVVLLVSTLVGFNVAYGAVADPGRFFSSGGNPSAEVTTVASTLSAHHLRDAYAGYWLAYYLEFMSNGRVRTMSLGFDRTPNQDPSVERARTAAWIYVAPGHLPHAAASLGSVYDLQDDAVPESTFLAYLAAHHIAVRHYRAGDFDVLVPARNVTPAELSSATG
jgi:hypothetical protein